MERTDPVSEERFPFKWAFEPLRQSLDRMDSAHRALRLSVAGVSMIVGLPMALEALGMAGDEGEFPKAGSAEGIADWAQEEMDRGFPLLYSQAVAALWQALETTVRQFVASWLANEPNAIMTPQVQTLRIELGKYEGLNFEERHLYVIDLLDKESLAYYKHGSARFEPLLEPFGLANPQTREHERNLLEMHHLRDVLLYREGIVDPRLIHECPWLEFRVGDPVRITYKDYGRYLDSAQEYLITLMRRVGAYYGIIQEEIPKSDVRAILP